MLETLHILLWKLVMRPSRTMNNWSKITEARWSCYPLILKVTNISFLLTISRDNSRKRYENHRNGHLTEETLIVCQIISTASPRACKEMYWERSVYTAISRKVAGKMCSRQSRKVIWDMINTHVHGLSFHSLKFLWRTVNSKPPTILSGLSRALFPTTFCRNSCIRA